MAMYLSTKFQSIRRNPHYGTKFAQNMNDKNLEKINMEIVISIQQCTPVPSFT